MLRRWCLSVLGVCGLLLLGTAQADVAPELEWSLPRMTPAQQWTKNPPSRLAREAARRQIADGPWVEFTAKDRAVFEAAQSGDWVAVAAALKNGTNPSLHARDGTSLVSLAVQAGAVEVVRDLVVRGAELDRRAGDGFTPLGAAAFHGLARIVPLLLEGGAETERTDATGATPLMEAARMGHLQVVDQLLAAHADPLHFTREGMHVLAVAASTGQVAVIERLLATGFEVDLPDRAGRSALYWSVYWQQKSATDYLLGHGAQLAAMSPSVFN